MTGGSRGIGAAIVRGAAARGHAVCFSYLQDSAAAQSLADDIGNAGGQALAVQGDVADPDFAPAFFDAALSAFGPATALVNNAGITGPLGKFGDVSTATLQRTLDVNLLGTMFMAREAVRRWQAAGTAGAIVNISSIAATLGAPGEYVHYAATKAGVVALTIGLGKEVAGSKIRVNAVAPGTAYTDIHATAGDPNRPERIVSRVPMGRIAQPDEIANAVLWLLSAEASYVTGAILRVSGGL